MQISSRIRRHTCAAATAPGLADTNTQTVVHASRHCAGVLLRLRLHATIKCTQQVPSTLMACTCMLGCCCGCICGGCC